MRYLKIAAVLIVLLAGCDKATVPTLDPVAKISGPAASEPGDLVILKTTGSVGNKYKWLIHPAAIQSKAFAVENGQTLIFASRTPCDATFWLIAVADNEVAIAQHELKNGGGAPPEPPGPGPKPPDPVPPKPPDPAPPNPPDPAPGDSVGLLRKAAKDLAVKTVPDVYRSRGAAILAKVYTDGAAKIGTGAYRTTKEAREGIRGAARQEIGWETYLQWETWGNDIAPYAEKVAKLDGQETLRNLQLAYAAIAAGLQEVK